MSAQSDQLAELVKDCIEHRDVNTRSVDNGYVITAQRRWVDPETNTAIAQLQTETIAEDHSVASERVANFLATGAFVND